MALTRTGLQNDYATTTLPGLLLAGLGLGTVSGSAMSAATVGVSPAETGVASATVNTTVQIGGSIGVALLMSLSASAPGLVVTWPAPRRILGWGRGACAGRIGRRGVVPRQVRETRP
ncbi:hypothetical protein [Amycolatopsis sp. NPDC051372]|uniref:hypothetical protein n=1 Tax=Amycolatopsis sp. NPDC051372 TaxID=3155669 RepID=UPI00342D5F53